MTSRVECVRCRIARAETLRVVTFQNLAGFDYVATGRERAEKEDKKKTKRRWALSIYL